MDAVSANVDPWTFLKTLLWDRDVLPRMSIDICYSKCCFLSAQYAALEEISDTWYLLRMYIISTKFCPHFHIRCWEWQWIHIIVSGFLELIAARAGVGVIYTQIICHACLLVPFSKKILIVIKLIWSCGNIILTKCVPCCCRMLLADWVLCVVSNLSTLPVKITANCRYQMSLMQKIISPP